MRGGDQGTTGPTDQRHRLFQAEALLLQHPRQPQPRTRPVMQQQPSPPPPPQQQLPTTMMLPPPQGFVGAGMLPQGMTTTGGFGAAVAASREEAEAAAARARAAEQMASEDAWKVLNPDFRTPFTSVEDAVTRLLPYHVFADHEDDGDGVDDNCSIGATVLQESSAQELEDELKAQTEHFLAEFEKQVLTFNVMTRQRTEGSSRAEEHLMLEMALCQDERRQTERVRAAIAQQQQQKQQEAARARLAIAHAQAAAAGAWPQQQAAQPSTPSWQHALAAAAAVACGQGSSSGGQLAVAPPPVFMQQQMSPHQQQQQQQQEMTMGGGTWEALAASRGDGCTGRQAMIQAMMMQQLQQQQQQQQQKQKQLEMMAAAAAAAARGEGGSVGGQALTPAMVMQLLHQQQQEMMAAGTWQMGGRQGYVTPRGDGSSSSQGGTVLQQQQPGQGQATMALPWRSSSERSEQ